MRKKLEKKNADNASNNNMEHGTNAEDDINAQH